jgi:broad specificity phosphatase PhoE
MAARGARRRLCRQAVATGVACLGGVRGNVDKPSSSSTAAIGVGPGVPGGAHSGERTLVIGRHGKPAVNRMEIMNADAYVTWWAQYERTGLATGQRPPSALLEAVARCGTVWASPAPRALETARATAAGRHVETSPLFVEAPLPPPHWPGFIVAQPGFWGVVARILWWLGFSRGDETRSEAEARAIAAVDMLEAEADRHGGVALLAHGWFNRMMRPVLRARGWQCVRDGGDTYWSFRVYRRSV